MTTTTTPPVDGRFGRFGGRYVPETLMAALESLTTSAHELLNDDRFRSELEREQREFIGRPTPLTLAERLSAVWGCRVLLKREDLAHTGAHKINNALGQALIAKHLGVKRIVAETGAGQHGVATAAAAARVGIPCTVYMGAKDVIRQAPNVERMKLLGATVLPVHKGDQTLRSAIDEAMRDWVADPTESYYLLGSVVGPHPYPWLVAELQSIIGREARQQILANTDRLPDVAVACVGGGSNAMGLFRGFVADVNVALLGVEAEGDGATHSATIAHGRDGVLHGSLSPVMQDEDGQILETHSIAPGLDYSGVGPEHAMLSESGRASYVGVTDDEALDALIECSRLEGILPALESAHALAGAKRWAKTHHGETALICVSGRGDKDLAIIREALDE